MFATLCRQTVARRNTSVHVFLFLENLSRLSFPAVASAQYRECVCVSVSGCVCVLWRVSVCVCWCVCARVPLPLARVLLPFVSFSVLLSFFLSSFLSSASL